MSVVNIHHSLQTLWFNCWLVYNLMVLGPLDSCLIGCCVCSQSDEYNVIMTNRNDGQNY